MSLYRAAVYGEYQYHGRMADVDVVVGLAFGTSTHPESVNWHLAETALARGHSCDAPVILEGTLEQARTTNSPPALVIDGTLTNSAGVGMGADGVLKEAKEFMDERGMRTALLIAQAFHIGRVEAQAQSRGMETVLPFGLPRAFDPESEQWWTTKQSLWIPRELIGLGFIKLPAPIRNGLGRILMSSSEPA